MKTFSVLAILARAANPWVSKATCPYMSTLRHCGCVTQPYRRPGLHSLHSVSHVPYVKAMVKLLEAFDHKVSFFLEAFCDVPINC